VRLGEATDQQLAVSAQAGSEEALREFLSRYRVKRDAIAEEYSNIDVPIEDRQAVVLHAFAKAANTWSPLGGASPVTLAKRIAQRDLVSLWRVHQAKGRIPASALDSLDEEGAMDYGGEDPSFRILTEDWEEAVQALQHREDEEAKAILECRPHKILRVALEECARAGGHPWVAVRDTLYPGPILIRMGPDPGSPEADDLLLCVHEEFCRLRRQLIDLMMEGNTKSEAAEAVSITVHLASLILEASSRPVWRGV
jgi:DNA-directed RNA polymerase specialized sigma24 family protein